MKEIIKIEEFDKLGLKLGEVKNASAKKSVIGCGINEYSGKIDIKLNKGDLIMISDLGDDLIIPVIEGDIPIIAEKPAKSGWMIS
jgi:hypothetical protein